MRLYIIRHADPDYEKGTITKFGHIEAKALSERLKVEGIDEIYCSPMNRAIETMNYTKKLLNLNEVILDWTHEIEDWMGDRTDKYRNPWDVPAEIILSQDEYPNHENWYKLKEYETLDINLKFEEIKSNSNKFIESLGYKFDGRKYECINHNEKKIAVFCHAGFGISWIAHLLQIPLTMIWAGFWPAPSSVTTILFEKRSDNYAMPRCIGFGDVSHLYKDGIQIKPRGITANFY